MCNFSHPFSELTKHYCHSRINYHFQTWLLSQQPFSGQKGFKTILIWVAPIYTWSFFSDPPRPPPKKRAQSKITLICTYSGLHFQNTDYNLSHWQLDLKNSLHLSLGHSRWYLNTGFGNCTTAKHFLAQLALVHSCQNLNAPKFWA